MKMTLILLMLLPIAFIYAESETVIPIRKEVTVAKHKCIVELTMDRDTGPRTDYWGTDGTIAKRRVKDVALEVDGVRWPCNREAFQDLGEVLYENQVDIVESDSVGALVLIIRGGDGGAGYSAAITMAKDGPQQRRVDSGGGFVTETCVWRGGIITERIYKNSIRDKE